MGRGWGRALVLLGAAACSRSTESAREGPPGLAPPEPVSAEPAPPAATQMEGPVRGVLQPGARRCYQDALKENPKLGGGRVVLEIDVGADGRVTSARATSDTAPKKVTDCCVGVARGLVFDPPGDGPAKLEVPLNFVAP